MSPLRVGDRVYVAEDHCHGRITAVFEHPPGSYYYRVNFPLTSPYANPNPWAIFRHHELALPAPAVPAQAGPAPSSTTCPEPRRL